MVHNLKIEPNYLANLDSGMKRSEIRLNDRDYQKGDLLQFGNLDITASRLFEITHIHSGLGLKEGYVCLSVTQVTEATRG